jgi:hypothetical protein
VCGTRTPAPSSRRAKLSNSVIWMTSSYYHNLINGKDMNIVKDSGDYYFFNKVAIFNKLEVGNYRLTWDPKFVPYITDERPFEFPAAPFFFEVDKDFREQVIITASARKGNTGVLLEGYKGQGKSITAKKLANDFNLPVIIITEPVPLGVDFVNKLNEIEQDCVIFIDEFEKIFKKPGEEKGDAKNHDQNIFLTWMDGALTSKWKKIFILTTNDEISSHFINRPSRIRYYKKYEYIDEGLYNNIIDKKLRNKEHEADLREHLPLFDCTIDLVNAIVDEINIMDLPYSKFKEFFNHKPRKISYSRYILKGSEYVYLDNIETDSPIDRATTNIANHYNCSVVNANDKTVHYTTKEWVYEENGMPEPEDEDDDEEETTPKKRKFVQTTYKLTRQPTSAPFSLTT